MLLLQDVHRGLPEAARSAVKRLRIVAVPPKVQPHMNQPVLGVSREDPGKFVLGTVPVERDGSAYFRLPSGLPVFFQAIDERGVALQTMRSLTYVQPNETVTCIGCHEARNTSPPGGAPPLALRNAPARIRPGPPGSWPLRFDDLVQPVLDGKCVSCHQAGAEDAEAAKYVLTADAAYSNLLAYADGDLEKLAFEKDRSFAGQGVADNSKLLRLLTADEAHYDVRLSADEFDRLATWMDTYAHRTGSFSAEQEEQLRQFRQQLAHLLDE
jgi:cytochrome c553